MVAQAEARSRLVGAVQGTTHLSVIDRWGNVASMTASNGSGSGEFIPGTGIQLNNMMGEEDLHPAGFEAAEPLGTVKKNGINTAYFEGRSIVARKHDQSVFI